jgi:hypothetical protein
MARYSLAVHCVSRCWLNPHTPDFPVLSLHVLKRELYFGASFQAESIEESPDVLGGHDSVDFVFRLTRDAQVSRHFLGGFKPSHARRRRRPRLR